MTTAAKIKSAFDQTLTDKGYTHSYENGYEFVFKNFNPTSLLEVGIKQGRSLAAWKILFPKCDITGVDITDKEFKNEYLKMAQSKNIICDSTKPELLQFLEPSYDVIIDDGSHFYLDIEKTFDLLKNRFKYAYVVEDSMYGTEVLVAYARSLGYTVSLFPCPKKQNIPVNAGVITSKKYRPESDNINVSLFLVVIQK
jgi:hypothetical protein